MGGARLRDEMAHYLLLLISSLQPPPSNLKPQTYSTCTCTTMYCTDESRQSFSLSQYIHSRSD